MEATEPLELAAASSAGMAAAAAAAAVASRSCVSSPLQSRWKKERMRSGRETVLFGTRDIALH